jgi:hypothetical protein
MNPYQLTLAILMGFSLAATCGLRAFLPLFLIALAAKSGMITLSQGFEWMQSYPALVCFGTATVLEIMGDKIPLVDHALDAAGTFVRPIAGAIAACSLIRGFNPLAALVLGLIVGPIMAGAIHSAKSSLRLASTFLTGGAANPALSLAEDGTAAVTGIAGLLIPLVTAAVIVVALVLVARFTISRLRAKTRPAQPT